MSRILLVDLDSDQGCPTVPAPAIFSCTRAFLEGFAPGTGDMVLGLARVVGFP